MDMIFYFCDRKKCECCFENCLHTSDPEHALDKDYWPYMRDMFGHYEQVCCVIYDYDVVEQMVNDKADN